MGHPMFKVLRQLVTGHHNLKACSSKITGGSPTCKCGQLETLEHFLYFCERYSRSRYEWTMNVSDILKTSSVPLRSVSWDILFGQQKDEGKSGTNEKLCLALLNFLGNTKRFWCWKCEQWVKSFYFIMICFSECGLSFSLGLTPI